MLLILAVFLTPSPACAQGFWTVDDRDHPEFRWQTIETEHFRIHFPLGLEEVARRAAVVSESVYGPVTRQLDTEPRRKTSIVLSDQDEVVNGYTLHTGQIFIWVNQNDDVRIFSGTEKWLRKVIAHEFQHVVTMEAMHTWATPWDLVGVPGWFLEGTAEYFTESWGLMRSDVALRAMTLRDRLGDLESHDSGFARVLYLATRYGDSTLVKIVKHRGPLRTYDFGSAFKKATGVSVAEFERDWSRTMNGHYYAELAAKEDIYDVGTPLKIPLRRLSGLAFSPDSTRIAMVGVPAGMRDRALYVVTADSLHLGREVDHGALDNRVSWRPDGSALVYARMHRGAHGSLLWDIYRTDLAGPTAKDATGPLPDGGRGRWLTRGERANDPAWSPDGREIVFLRHPGRTTNLVLMQEDGSGERPLTRFEGDVQILSPSFSPGGDWIAFTLFDEEGGPDIAVIRRDGSGFRHVTRDTSYDLDPVWSSDGARIYFTSDRDGTANLYAVAFDSAAAPGSPPAPVERLTDVGEGIWGVGRLPHTDRIVALTLGTVDSSRVVAVDGGRRAPLSDPVERAAFAAWPTHHPDITLPKLGPSALAESTVAMSAPAPYHPWSDVRLLGWAALPSIQGVSGLAAWNDALGRHTLGIAGGASWDGKDGGYQIAYVNAAHAPLLDFSLYSNVMVGLRMYDRDLLDEELRGGSAGMTFPLNFGDDLAANHTVRFSAELTRRSPRDPGRFVNSPLPVPVGGHDGAFGVEYRWLKRRPEVAADILPTQGTGAALSWRASDRKLYGDFTYRRWSAELFANRSLSPAGPVAFTRVKFDGVGGVPPAQDFVGITRDDPFYFPSGTVGDVLASAFLRRYETARLRGWPHVLLGDRALWGSGELRFPVADGFPVNVLGFAPGRITGGIFTDFASVWNRGDRPARHWRATEGAELTHELNLGEGTLFVGSWGVGQPWHEWRRGRTDHAEGYFRLALVNPF